MSDSLIPLTFMDEPITPELRGYADVTPEQVIANRAKAVRELIGGEKNQCVGSLFESDYNNETGDYDKHVRCAVGAIITGLTDGKVKTRREFVDWQTDMENENAYFEVYSWVGHHLGINPHGTPADGSITVSDIWTRNDDLDPDYPDTVERCSFESIGSWLAKLWDVESQ